MEKSTACWFIASSVMELDPNAINNELNSMDQLIAQNTWKDIQHYPESYCYPSFIVPSTSKITRNQEYKKPVEPRSWDPSCTQELSPTLACYSSSSATILSFGNQEYSPGSTSYSTHMCDNIVEVIKPKEFEEMESLNPSGAKRSHDIMDEQGTCTGTGGQCRGKATPRQDHVVAERKRREKLTQKFVALSALVPDLKKMDKASILEDAINYMKQLKEKVEKLENELAKKRRVDLAVVMHKSHELVVVTEDYTPSYDDNSELLLEPSDENHLEIEAKLFDRSILVRIHCHNHKGVLVKALSEIENLNLAVTNTSVIPFAGSFYITVLAQIEEGFSIQVKDLVKKLNSTLS